MNHSNRPGRWCSVAVLLLSFGLVVAGCSKSGAPLVMESSRFDNAAPDLKNKWKAASDYASQNNYLGAATNLIPLFGEAQQLTPEQSQALNQAWEQLGNKAFAAANTGDKQATETVLKMRDAKVGARTGAR